MQIESFGSGFAFAEWPSPVSSSPSKHRVLHGSTNALTGGVPISNSGNPASGLFRGTRIVLIQPYFGRRNFLVGVEIPRNNHFAAVPGEHLLQKLFWR
jgi:hypothetical protein